MSEWKPGDDFFIRWDDKTFEPRSEKQLERMIIAMTDIAGKFGFDLSQFVPGAAEPAKPMAEGGEMSAEDLSSCFAQKTTAPEGKETRIIILAGEVFGVELKPDDEINRLELRDGRVLVHIGNTVLNFEHDNSRGFVEFTREK